MQCITVAVGYADILAITLPRNRQHFSCMHLVTSEDTQDDAVVELGKQFNCSVTRTPAFYRDGASFNKFLAVNAALAAVRPRGWLCFMDADVVLPPTLPVNDFDAGNIYSPPRRMLVDTFAEIPPHTEWGRLPLGPPAPRGKIMAGYTQIFHTADVVLQALPWYGSDYKNASDGDTQFARRWPKANRLRPAFDVCHLGRDSVNWCGRVAEYADGSLPPQAGERLIQVQAFLAGRRAAARKAPEKPKRK